ncbi:hypothetical protein K461DRAFT_266737 [Myriangium duriaei CBS 260.36]|uniref:Ubiquitin 3 binding protein But2 C-terminal domain-containing protein n=1 Tax=Myriangium duriaei CBS 260.36 TaxID=1168546 RepID=A0A9P4J4V5_9PEZI|nr:hypothetical protein K461DRAFT_266737 [Myriangium duriaei CBS 260.36]
MKFTSTPLLIAVLTGTVLASPIDPVARSEKTADSELVKNKEAIDPHIRYTYPTSVKMYKLKTSMGTTSAQATLGGTVSGNTLLSSSTSSSWANFYLDGTNLVYASPTGPLYAQIPGIGNPAKFQVDTENVIFSTTKTGYELSCSRTVATGALACSYSTGVMTYNHFGLPSGGSPGHVVLYGAKTGPANFPAFASVFLI